MKHVPGVALFVAGLIHLLPVAGVLGTQPLMRLYGMEVSEPDTAILLQHRALLFGVLGAMMLRAIASPPLRFAAFAAGLISSAGFVAVALLKGGYNDAIARVVAADVMATALLGAGLAVEIALVARRGRPAEPSPELGLIAAGTALSVVLAATILAIAGDGREGTQLALRMTARLSFVWFFLTFIASPLNRLYPSAGSAWLLRNRRALGVTFGLGMLVHVYCILRLFVLYSPQRPPMVTDADFLIGVPGLLLVAALTVTSLGALRRRMQPAHWRRLHTTGAWFVWAVFILCLVDSAGRKQTDHPVLAYYLFIVLLLAGAGLRVAAARRASTLF
ncbi:MAG: ferric reductase-like transmembrane domain-containing protein [Rhodocyclaceae bacterium]|jgi:DMSO/TMAO reductase YedYZ heme-binding membrane subunit|nr:ferric reductase-like transmembrane domain-containing protein [Rhodocyclaceae bacterium]MCA3142370.1 ferric reductase-like transmembrane domain-containing protein [Rhodocyclaceae bacterium]MCE2899487.1 ferric reductase-like transmembrane domain-containing protein [Betaproteobacteria bacterium]